MAKSKKTRAQKPDFLGAYFALVFVLFALVYGMSLLMSFEPPTP